MMILLFWLSLTSLGVDSIVGARLVIITHLSLHHLIVLNVYLIC